MTVFFCANCGQPLTTELMEGQPLRGPQRPPATTGTARADRRRRTRLPLQDHSETLNPGRNHLEPTYAPGDHSKPVARLPQTVSTTAEK